MTPVEYLPILLRALGDRLPEVKLSRQYVNGDAPLPEMGPNLRESWIAFQKKARSNLGGRTCQSLAGRIIPLGVRVAGGGEAAEFARRYYRDNRLGAVISDAVWDSLATGYGYLLNQDVNGQPVATRERPEQMITIPNPLQPWRADAAVKAWRDKIHGADYATVWAGGLEQRFTRESKNEYGSFKRLNADGWKPFGDPVEFDGGVPVHTLENEFGIGEVTPHRDVIDRINLGKLQRLSTVAMQAYKQRVVEGLPEPDKEDPVDYGKIFEPAPGAIWDLPDGAKLHELQDGSAGIIAMLQGEEADIREYCGVTGTPMSNFLSDSQNQSAEGAMNAKEAEIAKAEKRISLFKPACEGLVVDALRVAGLDTGDSVELEFAPTAYVSFGERAQAALAAKNAGMPTRWIARHIWGRSADEISEIETDIAVEQLSLFDGAAA